MYPAPSRPCHCHLPCMQERSVHHHHPLQDQAGGGDSWLFGAILTSCTSLACQSERRWFHGVSTPFMPPPPPSHASSSWRRTFMVSPHRSHLFHPPCMQEQAGGEHSWPFDAASTPYISLSARLSRMWTFMALWRCPHLHLPRTQDRTGGGFMVCNRSSARI